MKTTMNSYRFFRGGLVLTLLLSFLLSSAFLTPVQAQTDMTDTDTTGSGEPPDGGSSPKPTPVPTPTPCPDPKITCPPDVPCWQTGTGAGQATPSGGCPPIDVKGERSDGQGLSAPFPEGTTTITWTVIDRNGKTATCQQRVTNKPDQNVSEVAFSLEAVNKVLSLLNKYVDKLKLPVKVEFSGQLTKSISQECCPTKPGEMTDKVKVSGSVSAGVGTQRLVLQTPPWSGDYTVTVFGRTIGVVYGAFGQFKASIKVSVGRTCKACTGENCWTIGVSGEGAFTGGLIGDLPNPALSAECGPNQNEKCSIIRVEAPLNTGFGVGAEGGCETLSASLQWSGLTAGLTVTLLEGTWFGFQVGGSLTLFQPVTLASGSTTLPKIADGKCD